MSSSGYLLAGLGAFLLCLGVQLACYQWLLRPVLKDGEPGRRRAGLKRWVLFAVAWQLAVLVAIAAYSIPTLGSHPHGLAWIAPPLGAIAGTALPLQLAVSGIARAALRG